MQKIKKILYFSYLASCLLIVSFFSYHLLNYKIFANYTIKNQDLVTPLFLNIEGTKVTEEERAVIKQINPIGVMLFELNFKSYDQVKSIIRDLKSIFPNRRLLIAIDQEGGRVDRIKSININNKKLLKSAYYYGKIAKNDLSRAKKEIYRDSNNTAKIMKDLGIDINFAPMVDLIHSKNKRNYKAQDSWSATNDRSFSNDPKIVIELAQTFIKGMQDNKIMVAIKHIPGLGRSYRDTHDDKSVIIDTKIDLLQKTDFAIFKALAKNAEFAMVGHAIYTDIDDKPATLSKKTIDLIRNEIGFKGILISDALNMKSVNKIENIGIKVLQSGIDIAIPNHLSYLLATNIVNNLDKKTLIDFNKKMQDRNLLTKIDDD